MKTLLLSFCILTLAAAYGQTGELRQQAEQSIKKSAGYFRLLGTDIGRTDVTMMLYLLQDHFKYPMDLLPVERFKEVNPELRSSYFKLYNTYFDGKSVPVMDDAAANEYLKNNLYTTDGLTAISMFCNKYPLPDDFLKVLNERADKGDYQMAHAAMQLANALNLGCLKPGNEVEKLREKLVKALVAGMSAENASDNGDDFKYECMAMLYYLGKGSLVTEDHIQFILRNQLPNGGWAGYYNEGRNNANAHSSVLALWVLLEYFSRNT